MKSNPNQRIDLIKKTAANRPPPHAMHIFVKKTKRNEKKKAGYPEARTE